MWILFIIQCVIYLTGVQGQKLKNFPADFMFGVSSSAYQVEGAGDRDGRGPSIWDGFKAADGSNGTSAAGSYDHYKRDVEMLRELGVDFYRFSISWSRVLPEGFSYKINEKGLQYYDNLIDELLKYNIEPVVTLYHFDLPKTLQYMGGWANPLVVDWFEEYSRIVFDRYSSKVKYWITINEPNLVCLEGYGTGTKAPFIKLNGIADYICVKNILMAHARVWRLFDKEYKKINNGSMGIALAVNWLEPASNSTADYEACVMYREFTIGLYAHPILSSQGGFPGIVKEMIGAKSKEQGFSRSRLPELSSSEVSFIKGTSDFLAVNHYTTRMVKRNHKSKFKAPSFKDDADVRLVVSSKWKKTKAPWLRIVPFGIYKSLIHLNRLYDYPKILITENGVATDVGLNDDVRVNYLKDYLKSVLLAIEDGSDVIGYAVWSLMDNFEWDTGYEVRFGLYQVDFKSQVRSPRKSALIYKRIIERKEIDQWEPREIKINISDRRLKVKEEL